jgi:hypothetical protein
MTGFEDTLTGILTEEAQRHEPPTFDAYRIAGRAARSRKRPVFALAAGFVAVAVVSAGVGYGVRGMQDRQLPGVAPTDGKQSPVVWPTGGKPGPGLKATEDKPSPGVVTTTESGQPSATATAPAGHPVTLTFARPAGAGGVGVEAVANVMRARVDAEQLKGAAVAVDGQNVIVTGDSTDLDRLKALNAPGVFRFAAVVDPSTLGLTAPAGIDCAKPQAPDVVQRMKVAKVAFVCTFDRSETLLVGSGYEYGPVSNVAVSRQVTGEATYTWSVDATVSNTVMQQFNSLTGSLRAKGGRFAILLDDVSYVAPVVPNGPAMSDGIIHIMPFFIAENDAREVGAVMKSGTLPADVSLVSVK